MRIPSKLAATLAAFLFPLGGLGASDATPREDRDLPRPVCLPYEDSSGWDSCNVDPDLLTDRCTLDRVPISNVMSAAQRSPRRRISPIIPNLYPPFGTFAAPSTNGRLLPFPRKQSCIPTRGESSH